jgi:hypothetical protein
MTEWPGDLLGQSDAPRPLPPDVRDRLEEALLTGDLSAEVETPSLGNSASNRLEVALSDPVAGALEDVDRPRPLRPATNRSLERAFARRNRPRRAAVLSAAAALVLLAAGLTVGLSQSGRSPSNGSTQALAPTSTRPASAANGAAGSGPSSAASAEGRAATAPQALGSDEAAKPPGPQATSAPVVAALSPDSGAAAGGTAVIITGKGMETAASVRFGSVPAQFRIVSATQLRAVAPAHAAGVVTVTVSTASHTNFASASLRFTYH